MNRNLNKKGNINTIKGSYFKACLPIENQGPLNVYLELNSQSLFTANFSHKRIKTFQGRFYLPPQYKATERTTRQISQ